MNGYPEKITESVRRKNANEPEFIQAVEEILNSIRPVFENNPDYEKAGLLERLVEPERMISFRVAWVDDAGNVRVNRGYRCQFNGAIGPYKGGLRFHPTVYPGIIKFLAFEQIFKNSLTGLPLGGGKGGADFDPKGKSDGEVMRFCQAFMTELYKYIGPDTDIPAGDLGVGPKEIGYLYGQYKRIRGKFESGVMTGKGLSYGGSLIRPEATGYGAVYFTNEVLRSGHDVIKGKKIAVSGFGNVAWGIAKKAAELGAEVITISGPDGYVFVEGGLTDEMIAYMPVMRASRRDRAKDFADKFKVPFRAGEKPWGVKADIVMPSATQNEVNIDDAKKIVRSGARYYIEVSNMPTSGEAMKYLTDGGLTVAPSKAVNAGGVAASALEMSQNSMRCSWTAEEVDGRLHDIMTNIHKNAVSAAEKYGLGYDLVAGAAIAGFEKVADAMMSQGVI